MMNVLIASLGDSPGVITETIDALEREEGIELTQVITIGTTDVDVRSSAEMLGRELAEYYRARIGYVPDYIDVTELLTEDDHLEYLAKVAKWLKAYTGQCCYLSLSGGRKTMSALVTVAAQIYGARALCHVVPVDPETEERGKVHNLRRLPRSEQARLFHPAADAIRLVRFPLISLFPLLDDFLAGLRGRADVGQHALKILESSGLIERAGIAIESTYAGRQLLSILEDVEQLPAPCGQKREEDVVVRDHGYGGKRGRVTSCARKLYWGCPWARRVETIPYGRTPRTGIRAMHPDGRVEIDVSTGEFSAGLCIHTTAQTEGQTRRVAREIERLLH
jgi:CRISPR-associated Csx14 family protein